MYIWHLYGHVTADSYSSCSTISSCLPTARATHSMRSSGSNFQRSHLAHSYSQSSLPLFCDDHAILFFTCQTGRCQVSSLPIKVGRHFRRNEASACLETFNPNSKGAKRHLLNQILNTFYDVVFFLQEPDLQSTEQGIIHCVSGNVYCMTCSPFPVCSFPQPRILVKTTNLRL